ncbi:MAG: hypothetical protein ABIH21_00550, partial [Patescibacteria group bacterium]
NPSMHLRELEVLRTLQKSEAQGSYYFASMIPELVNAGSYEDVEGKLHSVIIYRDKHEFDWTLADVMSEYPNGVDGQTLVWMMKRVLEILGWVEDNGFVHCGIAPAHVLIHPANHGAILLDWSHARIPGTQLGIISGSCEPYYPEMELDDKPVDSSTDIAMLCKTMIAVVGGNPATGDAPKEIPQKLTDLLWIHGRYLETDKKFRHQSALKLHDELVRTAEEIYGPASYHPFVMPAQQDK